MANRYWVGGTANWDGTAGTKWATTSGGAGGASVPSSSDDVFFDAASGAVTVTISGVVNSNNINFTGFTGTLAGSGGMNVYGNYTLASGMTITHTGPINFKATATGKTLTMNGKTLGSAINFDGVGGGWTLNDALNNGSQNITLTNGSLDTNGKTVTCSTFNGSGANTRSLTLGASTINFVTWEFTTVTNLTFSGGSSTLTSTAAAAIFNGGGLTYGTVNFSPSGGGSSAISGANTFGTLTITGAASKTGLITLGANQTVTGTFTCNGNSAVNRFFIQSDVVGTARTITAGTVTVSNIDLMDITGAGAGSWNIGGVAGGSGDCGGNSGITFTSPSTQTWATNTGNWSNSARWTSRVPLPQDDVIFNSSSFTLASQTVTADMPRSGKNITWTGVTNNPVYNLGNVTKMIFGSLTLVSGMSMGAGAFTVTFAGRGAYTLTSAGQTYNNDWTVSAPGGSVTLQDALTMLSGGILTLLNGTFDANNFNLTIGRFVSSNSNTRTINMGNGTWNLIGINNVWNLATTTNLTLNPANSTIKISDASATVKNFIGGSKTYHDLWLTGAGTGDFTIGGSNTFNDFKCDTPPHNIIFNAGSNQTVVTFSVEGSVGNLISLNSTTTTNFTLSKSSGTVICNYLSIANSDAGGGAAWYAGANSTDAGGGNTGWIFTNPTFSITKSLQYAIDVPTGLTKSLQYTVIAPKQVTKSLQYCIVTQELIQDSMQYAMDVTMTGPTKSLQYTVDTPQSIQESLQYTVIAPASVQKGMQYTVEVPSFYEKPLQYCIASPVPVPLELIYEVVAPDNITKSTQYTIFNDALSVTKSMAYAIRPYPYTRGTSPYSRRNPPYVALHR